MARVTVPRGTFERGEFPSICCKTGDRAEVFRIWEFQNTPPWTIILIFFGVLPYLIVAYFTTERFRGVLPFTARAQQRLDTWRRVGWTSGLGGVVLGIAGMMTGSAPLQVLTGGLLGVWILSIVLIWTSSPNARVGKDAVELFRVHPGFVRAVIDARTPS